MNRFRRLWAILTGHRELVEQVEYLIPMLARTRKEIALMKESLAVLEAAARRDDIAKHPEKYIQTRGPAQEKKT